MPITHIVMFSFKPGATEADIKDVCNNMLALKHKCIHPTTNKPYIVASSGGKDNSPEGIQRGMTHIFVVQFDDEGDRKYYLEQDPAHLGFVKSVASVVEQAQVVDFTPGVF